VEDLTNQLANFAFTCVGQAIALRKQVAEVEALQPETGWEDYDRTIKLEIATLELKARQWDARGVEAKRGFLLLDPDDVDFQMRNQTLVNECLSQKRVTYIEPQASGATALI
jgi:hypothetical protein